MEHIRKALRFTKEYFDSHPEIDESHGYKHAEDVFKLASEIALACGYEDDTYEMSLIQLAAITHDVDDSKYNPNYKEYENTKKILTAAGINPECFKEIIFMIGIISVSSNKDLCWIPEKSLMYQIIPRSDVLNLTVSNN